MPFYFNNQKKQQTKNKKASIAATLKTLLRITVYYVTCGLCGAKHGLNFKRNHAALKGSVGEEKKNTIILAEVNGGAADEKNCIGKYCRVNGSVGLYDYLLSTYS